MTEITELPWCKHGINKSGYCADCKVASLITTIESQNKELSTLKESQSVQAISERTAKLYNQKRQIESQEKELDGCYNHQDKLSKSIKELEENIGLYKLDVNRLTLMIDEFKCPGCGEFLDNFVESMANVKVKSDKVALIESQKEEIELKESEYQATITKLNLSHKAVESLQKELKQLRISISSYATDNFPPDSGHNLDLNRLSRVQEGEK